MMVARHFRHRRLILSVSTLGFFISSFSVVLASDFTGPVVSVLDGDTIESCTTNTPSVSVSAASTAQKEAKPTASERSRLHQCWP